MLEGHLRFGFLPDPRTKVAREVLADLLRQYDKCARQAGRYTSLVIFYETSLLRTLDVLGFESLFWSILSDLHQLDETVWPNHISMDPNHYSWEFCFGGQPYFAFCSTPSHHLRKSRYSEYFTMAFQPRFVFDDIHQNTAYGRRLKQAIRRRLAAYDEVPIHPALGWYGEAENHEWQQYFLRDNESMPTQCPFKHGTAWGADRLMLNESRLFPVPDEGHGDKQNDER
ncbi:hypothetical protein AAC03nite_28490 [Alicyclobacillus acidoterrestris]|nr:hypothetical protein AAC03nite_28490 [Alicyclobacillus acidoterrestris]